VRGAGCEVRGAGCGVRTFMIAAPCGPSRHTGVRDV